MSTTLSTDRVCELFNVKEATVISWIRGGAITPSNRGSQGRGLAREFHLIDIFPAWVARGMLAHGWTPEAATKVCAALQEYDEDGLQSAFDDGRCYLVAHHKGVHPELVTLGDINDPRFVKLAAEAGISPVAINVENAWNSLNAGVTKKRETSKAVENRIETMFRKTVKS